MDYDLIVIGAGPGGYEAAGEAASVYGMKTALVESRELGGTCLNRGCIPTKTFIHTAELFDELKRNGSVLGLSGADCVNVDMPALQQRKRDVVEKLRNGIETMLRKEKVDIYTGTGCITEPGKVRVTLAEDESAELTAKHILIATGSVPDTMDSLEGHDLPGVVTSDGLLDTEKIPETLLILGGGVIGMELAQVFNSLGSKVTVLKASSKIFNNIDKEPGMGLKQILKKRGVEIITGANVTGITGNASGLDQGADPSTDGTENNINTGKKTLVCSYSLEGDEDGQVHTIDAEMILLAKGRKANTEGLFDENCEALKAVGKDDKGRIKVNERFETGVPGIYAIGDVIDGKVLPGHAQLAHVATAEGRKCLAYINGAADETDLSVIPSCIYTDPGIAATGITPEEAKEKGIEVVTKKYPMGANGKAVLSEQDRGFIKIITEAGTGKILGASMMCPRATDMISIFSQAVAGGMTVEEMKKTIYPHPTFAEGIGELLRMI